MVRKQQEPSSSPFTFAGPSASHSYKQHAGDNSLPYHPNPDATPSPDRLSPSLPPQNPAPPRAISDPAFRPQRRSYDTFTPPARHTNPTTTSDPSRLHNSRPMSYSYRHTQLNRHNDVHRPLIDLIPDSLSVSDEEESFYYDNDPLIHPEWKAIFRKASTRIPRRVQRYSLIYLILLLTTWIGWRSVLGPRYWAQRMETEAMDSTPVYGFEGDNVGAEFKHLIMVKKLDKELVPTVENGRRLIIVGDVHGCRQELEHLMKKVDFDMKRDHLVLTGDMVSKGPDSPGVVSYAASVGASSVRGNHEDRLLLTHHMMTTTPEGALTEESLPKSDREVRALARKFTKEQIHWLNQCPVILHIGSVGTHLPDVSVVHAGLVPNVPLKKQDPYQCMNMRTIDLKTRLPSEGRDHTPWDKFWNHQQKNNAKGEQSTVIYGHDKKRGRVLKKYSMGLDSGCVSGGTLTAMVIDGKGNYKMKEVKCKGYVD